MFRNSKNNLIICLLWLFLISPWIFGGQTIPWDAKAHWYPHLVFLSNAIHSGESVLWNPYIFAGSPESADPQSAIFILPLLITAILTKDPTPWMMDLSIFITILVGMWGVIALFRYRKWHDEGGLIAALAFGFGASMAWRLQHVNQVATLCFFPICLLFLERAIVEKSVKYGVIAGLVAAVIALSRDQVSLIIIYWLTFYTIYQIFTNEKPLKLIPPLASGAIVASCIILIPLFLTFLWGGMSNRPVIDETSAGRGSLHPLNLLTLFVGNLFGAGGEFENHWGLPSLVFNHTGLYLARNMSVLYLGALPCFLLILGLSKRHLWHKDIRFTTVSCLVVFLYCIGWYTPAFDVMYKLLPFVNNFRRPADATFLFGALSAILAGYVWHKIREKAEKIRIYELIVPVVVIAASFALAIYKHTLHLALDDLYIACITWLLVIAFMFIALKYRNKWLFYPLLLVLAADLYVTNGTSESTALPTQTYEMLNPFTENETVNFLKNNLKPLERIEMRGLGYHWQNASMVHSFFDVLGFNPLRESYYSRAVGTEDVASEMQQRLFPATFTDYNSPLADMLGLRYIVTGKALENMTPLKTTKDSYIYERKSLLPRAIFAHKAAKIDIDGLMETGEFPKADFSNTVMLPRDMAETTAGTVRIVQYTNAYIELESLSDKGGMVVLHDVYHPWWFAAVNNKTVKIERANLLFRGIEVPAGKAKIVLTFRPLKGAVR